MHVSYQFYIKKRTYFIRIISVMLKIEYSYLNTFRSFHIIHIVKTFYVKEYVVTVMFSRGSTLLNIFEPISIDIHLSHSSEVSISVGCFESIYNICVVQLRGEPTADSIISSKVVIYFCRVIISKPVPGALKIHVGTLLVDSPV